jgi:hypothetical protein
MTVRVTFDYAGGRASGELVAENGKTVLIRMHAPALRDARVHKVITRHRKKHNVKIESGDGV